MADGGEFPRNWLSSAGAGRSRKRRGWSRVSAVYGVPPGQIHELDWSATGAAIAQIARYPAEEHLHYGWALDMLRRGHVPLRKLLTHRWPLAEGPKAFEELTTGRVVKGMLVTA